MRKGDEVLYQGDGVVRPSRGTVCTEEEGKVRQEFKDETDINRIVHRLSSGVVPMVSARPGEYLDVSGFSGGLREALDRVHDAEVAYLALPAGVRRHFKDALSFTQAFETEDGVAQLRELGVIAPTEEEVADAREAAAEDRARRRADRRAEAARVEAAKKPPTDVKA